MRYAQHSIYTAVLQQTRGPCQQWAKPATDKNKSTMLQDHIWHCCSFLDLRLIDLCGFLLAKNEKKQFLFCMARKMSNSRASTVPNRT